MAFGKYLRTETILGIGIGFILSAFLVSSFPSAPSISNQEIIERAQELGMVTREQYEAVLNGASQSKEAQKGIENGETLQNEVEQVEPQGSEPVQETEIEKSANQNSSNNKVKVTIPGGSGSENIAKILEENGLIDDIGEFQDTVLSKGLQRKFQKGDFIIPANANLDEVINILTHYPNG